MHVCHSCWDLKERADFGRNPKMRTGYLRQCKDCRRVWLRDYRERNRATIRAKQLEWERQPDSKAKMAARLSLWRQLFPKRRAAHVAVGNALRDGRLQRLPCWACGDNAQAHHPNYDAPLDVVWLCRKHHKAAHAAGA